MKILTSIGTRPELIRLSRIIPRLDKLCDHTLVHTGQNYDTNMRDVFFDELCIRQPDYQFKTRGTALQWIGRTIVEMGKLLQKVAPDRVLILGDTNSAFATAYTARRLGIPVYHMEAGNRCFDINMPEELNRRAIDHMCNIHMAYTERARQNLLREGIPSQDIYVVGNPIEEVLSSLKLNGNLPFSLDLDTYGYFLVTAHREENVDNKERLTGILDACLQLVDQYGMPVVFSRHPRTAKRMREWDMGYDAIQFHEPFGIRDFMTLEMYAFCTLSDSGTVQEELCIMKRPCVTIRDVTERPETVECGSNIIAGVKPNDVLSAVKVAVSSSPEWQPPSEYIRKNVSDTVVKIVLGS